MPSTFIPSPLISDYTSVYQEPQDDTSSMTSLLDLSNSDLESGHNISSLPCDVELESMVSNSTANRHRKKGVGRDRAERSGSYSRSGTYTRLTENQNQSSQNSKIVICIYLF